MDSKQGSEISLHFCFHIASPSGKRGVSFQSILDDVRLNNALSAIQTTVKPISEIARKMVTSVLLVLLKGSIIVLR